MTIQSTSRKTALFSGNDVTTSFPFTFKVQDSDDVVVYRLEDDEEEVVATGYTVSLNANQNSNPGGTVDFTTAPTSDQDILVTTEADATQEQSIQNQAAFNPSIVMEALDKLTILTQQLVEKSARTLAYPITSPFDDNIPGAEERASTLLGFDASGKLACMAATDLPENSVHSSWLTALGTTRGATAITYTAPITMTPVAGAVIFSGIYGANNSPFAVSSSAGYTLASLALYGTPGAGSTDALSICLELRASLQAGSRGIACALYARAASDGSHAAGGSLETGAIAGQFDAITTRGTTIFGASINLQATAIAGAIMRGIEIDVESITVHPLSKVGIVILSTASDTGITSGTITIQGGNTTVNEFAFGIAVVSPGVGFYNGFLAVKESGGAQPIKTTGSVIRAGGYTCVAALNVRDLTVSEAVIIAANDQILVAARNAANNANIEALRVAGDNSVVLGGKLFVNPTTGVPTISANTIILTTARTPASAAAAGTVGSLCWDTGFLYVATATDTWERVAIATW